MGGLDGNTLLRGYIDPPQVAAILRQIHGLDVEREKLYRAAGQEFEPNVKRKLRLEQLAEQINGLWAAVRRERFKFSEAA